MDYSPPGSSVYGIFQTRKLEWVAALVLGIFPTPGSNPNLRPDLAGGTFITEPSGKPIKGWERGKVSIAWAS